MSLRIVESKSLSPRRARTLPSWLLAVGSSSTSESSEDRGVDSSRSLRNPLANAAIAEVSSCDDAAVISSSSTNTVNADQALVGGVQAVETVFVAGINGTNFIREDDDSAANGQSADSTNVEVVKIKVEPEDIDSHVQAGDRIGDEAADCSTTMPSSNNVPVCPSSSPPTSGDTSILPGRRMCLYGRNCYRTNAQHKIDFSHPDDADYDDQPECDSTTINPAVTKARCWYGSNCYRKNEEHRQKFSHSPLRTNRNTTRTRRENSNEQEDSDEYDNSFIDDDGFSDESGNASSEEIEGFSDFEDYSSSDDDSYGGPGKPKKKKFSIF